MDKPRMRQITVQGPITAYKVWRVTYRGHEARAVCPVWAYVTLMQRIRKEH